ncbi:LysR family transcriptional regulator [Defluviimonas sp. SAOS-178_SWC]|uniref:LysR family transcriptional regulator n=1 Tax=Defluviimonas sp. SAOS-178_SWC TaxID=3121287 RepID=UPI003221B05A
MSFQLVPRSLQYLERVAQTGSIQAASRETGISASAIHRQIKLLEDALGELLFERDVQGMSLTPTGQMILDLARDWRLDSTRLVSTIEANRGIEYGHVRIAAMDGMVNGFALELSRVLAEKFPRVHARIEVTSPVNAVKGVLNGDFDLAVVVNAAPDDDLIFHWQRDYRLGCIAVPGHPVAGRDRIALKELAPHPAVFQSTALSIRRLLEVRHGWLFERALQSVEVNSIQLMKLLVLTGQFIAVTSELDAGPELRSGQLRFVPLSDSDLFQQNFAVISNVQIPASETVRKITEIAVGILRKHADPDGAGA